MNVDALTYRRIFLDPFFPRRCLQCDSIMSLDSTGEYLCTGCTASLEMNTLLRCAFCAAQTQYGQTCPFCRPNHALDQLFVAASYDTPVIQRAIKLLKYRFVRDVSRDLTPFVLDYARQYILPKVSLPVASTIVAPVPLHFLRHNWRGFNQAELIAQPLAQTFSWQYEPRLLRKHYRARPQAEITDRKSRLTNMTGVFSCVLPAAVKSKTILLIDDVSTTGATLDDAARALKAAGAKKVIGFVLARGA